MKIVLFILLAAFVGLTVFHLVHHRLFCRYRNVPGKSHCKTCGHRNVCQKYHHKSNVD